MAMSACVALAQLPVCVARVPPTAPLARSAGVSLISLCPVVSTSVTGAIVALCLTRAAELGVDMVGPSLPICPHVATILVLSGSGFNRFQSYDQCGAGRTMVLTPVVFSPH